MTMLDMEVKPMQQVHEQNSQQPHSKLTSSILCTVICYSYKKHVIVNYSGECALLPDSLLEL